MISLAKGVKDRFNQYDTKRQSIDSPLYNTLMEICEQTDDEMPFELYNRFDWDCYSKDHKRQLYMTHIIRPIEPLQSVTFTVTIGKDNDITFN